MSPANTERNTAGRALAQLDRARAEILGVVISAVSGATAFTALRQLFIDSPKSNGRLISESRDGETGRPTVYEENGREHEAADGRHRLRDRLSPRRPDR